MLGVNLNNEAQQDDNMYIEITIEDVNPFFSIVSLLSTVDPTISIIPFTFTGGGLKTVLHTKRNKKKENVIFVSATFPKAALTHYALYNETEGTAERVFDENTEYNIVVNPTLLLERTKGIKKDDVIKFNTEPQTDTTSSKILYFSINGKGKNQITLPSNLTGDVVGIKFPNIGISHDCPNISINKTAFMDFVGELKRLKKDAELTTKVYASGIEFNYKDYGSQDSGYCSFGDKDIEIVSMVLDIQAFTFVASKLNKFCPDKGVIRLYGTKTDDGHFFMISAPIGASGMLDVLCAPDSILDKRSN